MANEAAIDELRSAPIESLSPEESRDLLLLIKSKLI
jgi:hypothetical protein